jgi:c-di-GMP-binding flagellar brake protein YcgR
MRKERRKDTRIDLFVQDKIKHQGLHNVKNLSLSGLFIQMLNPSQFETGDKIEVVMQLPAEDKPTHLDARVRRIAMDGVGIEFVKVPPKQQVALQYCVDVFKHTVPLPNS